MAVESARIRHVSYPFSEATLSALGQWVVTFLSVLGAEVLRELGHFSRAAGPGAMITIRRTRDGFTAQVTGAIVGGGTEPLTVDAVEAMTLEVDGNGTHLSE